MTIIPPPIVSQQVTQHVPSPRHVPFIAAGRIQRQIPKTIEMPQAGLYKSQEQLRIALTNVRH